MLKIIYLSLFLCTLSTALCQPTRQDSLIKAARSDAKKFRLDDAIWKKYKHTLPSASDYFKPSEANQENRALLTDSLYVEAYRQQHLKATNTGIHLGTMYCLLANYLSS